MLLCFHDPGSPSDLVYYGPEDIQALFDRVARNAKMLCRNIPAVVDSGHHDFTTYRRDKVLSEKMEQKFAAIRPTYDALIMDAVRIDSLRCSKLRFCRDDRDPIFPAAHPYGSANPMLGLEKDLAICLRVFVSDFTDDNVRGLVSDFFRTCCIRENWDGRLIFEYPYHFVYADIGKYPYDFIYKGAGVPTDTEEVRKDLLQNIVKFCDKQSAKILEYFARAEKIVAEHGVNEVTVATS